MKQFYLGMATQAFITAGILLLGYVVAPIGLILAGVTFLALYAFVYARSARE
jgi:hypothetical protein